MRRSDAPISTSSEHMCAAAAEQLRGNRANTHARTHRHSKKPHRPLACCLWTSRRTDRLHPTSASHVCFSSAGQRLFLLYNLDDWKVFFLLPSPNPGLHHVQHVTTGCFKVLQSSLTESCFLSLKKEKKKKIQTDGGSSHYFKWIYFSQLSHAHVQ